MFSKRLDYCWLEPVQNGGVPTPRSPGLLQEGVGRKHAAPPGAAVQEMKPSVSRHQAVTLAACGRGPSARGFV